MPQQLTRGLYGSLLVTMILAAGCGREGAPGRGSDEVAEERRYGGTAVVASIVDMTDMNSLTSSETTPRMFQREVLFMPLVRYEADLLTVPWLAERWDTVRVAPDSLELTFHLRRDVRWHDGRPTTADDVVFTFQRVSDPRVASSLTTHFAHFSPRIERVDSFTVRVRFRPHAEFLHGWTQLAIMPSHILGEVPPEELARHPFSTSEPVGNGPFRFVRRVPGQEWVFEANPDFPAELGGRPYLDRLVYRVIPDQTTLLTELLTGGIDVYLGLNPSQIDQVQQAGSAEVISTPSFAWSYIAWNTRLSMFDAPEERRALSMAIDRSRLVEAVLHRRGEEGYATVTPSHWAFDRDSRGTVIPYDVEGARRLLAQAGWADRDGDGILEDAGGRPFRFSLKVPQGNQARHDVAQIVQAQLRPLGIDVRPTVVEGNTLISQLDGRLDSRGERVRDFEAVVFSATDGFRKDDSQLFHSRHRQNIMHISGFTDARIDYLLDTLPLIVDREQARPLWKEYQTLMAQHAPHTVLYYANHSIGVSKRLRGVESDVRGQLITVRDWWVGDRE